MPGYNIYGFFELRNKLLLMGLRLIMGYKTLRIYPKGLKGYLKSANRINHYFTIFPRFHLYFPTKKRNISFYMGPDFLILIKSSLSDFDKSKLVANKQNPKVPLPRFNQGFVMLLGWGLDIQTKSNFILTFGFYHSLSGVLNNEYLLDIDEKTNVLHALSLSLAYDFAPLL